MKVKVKLFATFQVGRFTQKDMDYPPGITVRQIMQNLGINTNESGLVVINGKLADVERVLLGNDVIGIFPVVAGG